MAEPPRFSRATFRFLHELALHNERAWFQANRERYERDVRGPALAFVEVFGPRLARISRHLVADARPSGGSLFRIHRDIRFSKDKSPYKTSIGIQFRHAAGRDVHAPGFYLHVEPGDVFMGCGMWRPGSEALGRVRSAIVDAPARWRRAVGANGFRSRFELAGDALVRAPRGFDPDHPLIADLRRKDFIAVAGLDEDLVTSAELVPAFEAGCRAARPFMRFLCQAVGVPF